MARKKQKASKPLKALPSLKKLDDLSKGSESGKLPEIPTFKEVEVNSKTSFWIPSSIQKPQDPCGLHPSDIPDLQIIKKRGRPSGYKDPPDPIAKKNYLSISDRWDRSLDLVPIAKFERDGKRVYRFCSSNSPTGYWEVEVGGQGTFLSFDPPILTVICPRPFQLSELVEVLTDGTSITWTQIQGRTTIVSPNVGDGSLDPTIAIIGPRVSTDPPIFLQAVLTDNALVGEVLVIRTTLTEIVPPPGGLEVTEPFGDPLRRVSQIVPIASPNSVIDLSLQPSITITWVPPTIDSQWREAYQVQVNNGVSYQAWDDVSVSDPLLTTIEKGKTYRILSIYDHLNLGYSPIWSIADSARFRYDESSEGRSLLGGDALKSVSGSDNRPVATQYDLAVIGVNVVEQLNKVSGAENRGTATQYDLISQQVEVIIEQLNKASGYENRILATQYDLSGAIVG